MGYEVGFLKYLQYFHTEQLSRSYLEKEEACQKISSSLFSDPEQIEDVKAEERWINQTNYLRQNM